MVPYESAERWQLDRAATKWADACEDSFLPAQVVSSLSLFLYEAGMGIKEYALC